MTAPHIHSSEHSLAALWPEKTDNQEHVPQTRGQGSNRAPVHFLKIQADNDASAVATWLARYEDSRATYANYRKEAERLMLWALHELKKPLSALDHNDLQRYQSFLADPQPQERWCMPAGKKLARQDPEWRPFVGPLSSASQRQALLILNGLFTWLVAAGYLAANPLALARKRSRLPPSTVTRYLNEIQWSAVKHIVLAHSDSGGSAHPSADPMHRTRARNRWLLSVLYGCGLRVSELVTATMGDIHTRPDTLGTQRWWLNIKNGKGGKARWVPLTQELVSELEHYRVANGMPAQPVFGESYPLVLPLKGDLRPLTRSAVHIILKNIFSQAAAWLRAQGPAYEVHASPLERASAHWLRHTAGSHMMNNAMDIRHVRDTLGHASLTTTNTYLHTEENARHAATELHHHLNWQEAV